MILGVGYRKPLDVLRRGCPVQVTETPRWRVMATVCCSVLNINVNNEPQALITGGNDYEYALSYSDARS